MWVYSFFKTLGEEEVRLYTSVNINPLKICQSVSVCAPMGDASVPRPWRIVRRNQLQLCFKKLAVLATIQPASQVMRPESTYLEFSSSVHPGFTTA